MALVSLLDVSLSFGGAPLLDRVNLQIDRGERVCLVGRNGAGKSTLMKVIAGDPSFQAYQAMTSASMALDTAINARRTQAVRSANGFSTLLGVTLFGIFFTPVFYSPAQFGARATVLLLNPLSPILEALAATVVEHRAPSLPWLAYSAVWAVGLFVGAIVRFRRVEPLFAENI